jgi:hypothetical protein
VTTPRVVLLETLLQRLFTEHLVYEPATAGVSPPRVTAYWEGEIMGIEIDADTAAAVSRLLAPLIERGAVPNLGDIPRFLYSSAGTRKHILDPRRLVRYAWGIASMQWGWCGQPFYVIERMWDPSDLGRRARLEALPTCRTCERLEARYIEERAS